RAYAPGGSERRERVQRADHRGSGGSGEDRAAQGRDEDGTGAGRPDGRKDAERERDRAGQG
ncbi:hypothetical protein ABZ726_20115, partial [Streptomyces hundungensis]|uniref:hypothetical protein n=1 Tax=Streptomyces hundungensis TaxID=1077946 RepID=UPI003474B974